MARKNRTISVITGPMIAATGFSSPPKGGFLVEPEIATDFMNLPSGVIDSMDLLNSEKEPKFAGHYWPWPRSPSRAASAVNALELSRSLSEMLKSMGDVLSSLPAFVGEFNIDSMTLDVEISAEGSVSLLGTGGSLGGKGGISLVLKRNQPRSDGGAPLKPGATAT